MAYIDKGYISANLFNGEDVPGPNTISQARFSAILTRVTNFINGFLQSESDVDDTYGELAEISLSLFKQAVQDQDLEFTNTQRLILKNKYYSAPRLKPIKYTQYRWSD